MELSSRLFVAKHSLWRLTWASVEVRYFGCLGVRFLSFLFWRCSGITSHVGAYDGDGVSVGFGHLA